MILVFGSLNIDLVLAVPRIPRPGETVLAPSYEKKPGGKGANQAVAAARAGGRVAMAGAVGDDGFGREVIDNLAAQGVDTTLLRTVDRPTGLACITVDADAENAIAVASGANGVADSGTIPDTALGPDTLVVLQMEVPPAANWRLIERARARGARVMLSLAPAGAIPEDAFRGLDVFLVNRLEAEMAADALGLASADIETTARTLARRGGTLVIVTLGAEGVLATDGESVLTQPSLRVDPVDTTGAGDTFAGVLAAGLDAGLGLAEALARASTAAALACTALGAQESMPTAAQIDQRMSDLPAANLAGPGFGD
ncbi:MAG: ribokinase [Azospirillaceae bacterium]